MSWALEEWKEGLPTRALQKIQELEGQLDKLKKERQQRQFQLETLEAALQKQKQKVALKRWYLQLCTGSVGALFHLGLFDFEQSDFAISLGGNDPSPFLESF